MVPEHFQGMPKDLNQQNDDRLVPASADQRSATYGESAMRRIEVDEDYSGGRIVGSNPIESVDLNKADQDMQNQITQYANDQTVPQSILAANWKRIFDHLYPKDIHLLDPFCDDPSRLVGFVRSYFALSALNDLVNLDAIANEPDVSRYLDALASKGPLGAESGNGPRHDLAVIFKYACLEDWLDDLDKPHGWVFDEETQHLVPTQYWLNRQQQNEIEYNLAEEAKETKRIQEEESTAKIVGVSQLFDNMQLDDEHNAAAEENDTEQTGETRQRHPPYK